MKTALSINTIHLNQFVKNSGIMRKIRVAIIGIGNCASSLVQGIEYYKWVDKKSDFVPGIMNNIIRDYCIHDIEFVAAFDVNKNKVGKDLSDAIFSAPNCASKFSEVPPSGIKVLRGPLLDGLNENFKEIVSVDHTQPEINVAEALRDADAEIVINYLPTGSKQATKYYAQQALDAQCGFINGIPESIAHSQEWREKYEHAGLPLVGDDIKSQLGATPLHRALIDLFVRGGCKITNTQQINIGSNTDFINLSDPERIISKKNCKVSALQHLIPYPTDISVDIQLKDNYANGNFERETCDDAKRVKIHFDGENFGSRPMTLDVEFSAEDSPNGAGTMVDVIRATKVALDRGDSGAIHPICGRHFKNPPLLIDDIKAGKNFDDYIGKKS